MPPRKSKPDTNKGAPATLVSGEPAVYESRDTRFKPGQSGNPAGRTKGSRNKLGEAFIQDMYDAWIENGKSVIKAAMENQPAGFIKSMVSILPQEVVVKNDMNELSNEELTDILFTLRSIADAGNHQADRGGAAQAKQDPVRREQLN